MIKGPRQTILHLTPHFGGGVGQVLRAILPEMKHSGFDVRVASLEDVNDQSKSVLEKNSISYLERAEDNLELLSKIMADVDIIVVHWWNHPSLIFFLKTKEIPKGRFIFWSHTSGLFPPNCFSAEMINAPQKFILSTPLSFLSNEVDWDTGALADSVEVIWSTAGVEYLLNFDTKSFASRDIGFIYCGNLDLSKVDRSIFKIAKELKRKTGHKLVVVGPITSQFNEEFDKFQCGDCIRITGYVNEAQKIELIRRSRVFVYPLNSHHYGSCDQTIQEAMALGLPVVAYCNPMESHMVRHKETGFLETNVENFVERCCELESNQFSWNRYSKNCIRFARQAYSVKSCVGRFATVFDGLTNTEKKQLDIRQIDESDIWNLFLSSLGSQGRFLSRFSWSLGQTEESQVYSIEDLSLRNLARSLSASDRWMSLTKSSPYHWSEKFPGDVRLLSFCRYLEES